MYRTSNAVAHFTNEYRNSIIFVYTTCRVIFSMNSWYRIIWNDTSVTTVLMTIIIINVRRCEMCSINCLCFILNPLINWQVQIDSPSKTLFALSKHFSLAVIALESRDYHYEPLSVDPVQCIWNPLHILLAYVYMHLHYNSNQYWFNWGALHVPRIRIIRWYDFTLRIIYITNPNWYLSTSVKLLYIICFCRKWNFN